MELPPENSEGVSPGTWDKTSEPNGVTRWDDFVETMNIRKPDSTLAKWSDDKDNGWRKQSIYFLPSCSYHEPKGQTGGENFGILARIPVLVD